MESNKKNDMNEKSNMVILDSPAKIAEWMRKADYAFDFRGSSQWERSGGISVSTYGPSLLEK